jgi:hypothetical protein
MMHEQDITNTLNALGKLQAAAGAMSATGWAAMARAAERTAATTNVHGVANTLNALSKVKTAADAMSPAGWAAMARAAECTAPMTHEQENVNTLAAIANLPTKCVVGDMEALNIKSIQALEAISKREKILLQKLLSLNNSVIANIFC